MEDNNNNSPNDNQEREARPIFPIWILAGLLLIIFASYLISQVAFAQQESVIKISYLEQLLDGNDYKGNPLKKEDGSLVGCPIASVQYGEQFATGIFSFLPPAEPKLTKDGRYEPVKSDQPLKNRFKVKLYPETELRAQLLARIREAGITSVEVVKESEGITTSTMIMILIAIGMVVFLFYLLRRQSQMMNGGGFLSNFAKSPAKKYEAAAQPVTFDDVAGLEGVKADLREIVEFLKEPGKFQKLGGRVPKGVLLVGPPGTGKTLLARAVAGEAGVPYFSVNGSEFIQMFVGVGASRVRDLFSTAKSQSPAIIFIDEIDAVGRQRGAGLGGGHDEREQTLNQILGEMDGFQANDSVIVVAATNRPDILDPALLRPGRFDRHVTVSRPTKEGRLEIFKVHVRDVPLAKNVDLKIMAQATAGMTGADIQNLVNEAALWAARNGKNKVEMSDFYYAHDKVLMGAKREEILSEQEKERTAYHEVGHTLTAWRLKGAYPVHKVTIIPRGQALGVTQMVPSEDKMNLSKADIKDNLIVLMAGRAAEMIVYNELNSGAERDLEQATSMARRMVTHWGMSDTLGPVSYKMTDEDPFLGREMQKSRQFSEHTMEVIDEEVNKLLRTAAVEAQKMLEENWDDVEALTKKLLEKEELDRIEIEEIVGPSVHKQAEPIKKETPESENESSEDKSSEGDGMKSSKSDSGSSENTSDASSNGSESGGTSPDTSSKASDVSE